LANNTAFPIAVSVPNIPCKSFNACCLIASLEFARACSSSISFWFLIAVFVAIVSLSISNLSIVAEVVSC